MAITPIDKGKAINGVEVDYYGVTLNVTRANNTKFKHMFKTLITPFKYQMDNNQSIPEETSEDIMFKCYSETILTGWKNYKDDEGKNIPYSSSEAYKLLKEDEDLYDFIKIQSSNMDLFINNSEDSTKGK